MRTSVSVFPLWVGLVVGVATGPVRVAAASGQEQQPPEIAHTEPHPAGPPARLADFLQEALEMNPELMALRRQIDVARQRPIQERFLKAPMAEAQVWQWPLNSINPAGTNMYMFMASQELPGRGKRQLRAAVAEKDITLAESDLVVRERDVVNQVKHAYAALFVARKAIEVHLASIDLLRQMTDVSQVKYAAGRISQQNVLKPVVEASILHKDIFMFDEQASIAVARLNVLLDRAPETPIGPLVEPRGEMGLPATADLQRLAVARQPQLQRARVEVERAEAELALVKREYGPDFTVQGGYMLAPRMTDAWMGRVGLTWPTAPWSRGKIDAQVAERAAGVGAAKARARAMENAVRLAVQEAYARAKAAQDRAALLRTTILPQSRQTFEVARVAYQADRLDFQAVIDSERVLLDSLVDYYHTLAESEQALADLERAVGTDLPGPAEAINEER